MHVISINLGRPESLENSKSGSLTGIIKRPINGEIRISKDGLPGDTICNTKYHGGPDQAIYLYGRSDYAWWEESLGMPLAPGIFGENLTLSNLESASLHVGDRFHIRDTVLEITSPRIPCSTLASRMNDSGFIKKFRAAERPGVYCRVMVEGSIQPGDPVEYHPMPGPRVGILEIFRDAFHPTDDPDQIRRHLAAPLAIRMREPKEKQLAKANAN